MISTLKVDQSIIEKYRWMTTQKPPDGSIAVSLPFDLVGWIDLDFVLEYTKHYWHFKKAWKSIYVIRSLNNETKSKEFLHNYVIGRSKGYVVDHINGNTLDNRRSNLRHITNGENIFKSFSRSSIGIRLHRTDSGRLNGQWRSFSGRSNLGIHDTMHSAAVARSKFEQKMYPNSFRTPEKIIELYNLYQLSNSPPA